MERFGVPRGKRPRVQVSLDEKERAIARIRSGETKAGISRELGVPESTVRGWVKRAEQRMARDAALPPATNGFSSSILAMALAKPQLTITQAPPTPSSSSPSLAKSVAPKRSFNGHLLPPPPPPLGSNPLQHLAAQAPVPPMDPVAMPICVPLSMPFPVPSFVTTNVDLPVLGWLNIFNAGILNFTLITTAALLQARARGLADSLPLWQIIRDYADEAASNVAANGGHYVPTSAPPIKSTTQVARMTSPRQRELRSNRVNAKAPLRLHITAEDDEDGSTETEVDL